jgi:hypothetical protein
MLFVTDSIQLIQRISITFHRRSQEVRYVKRIPGWTYHVWFCLPVHPSTYLIL